MVRQNLTLAGYLSCLGTGGGLPLAETLIDGPYFEDLRHGQLFEDCPGLTLTEGLAAAHRAIVGGRLPLALDGELSRRVLGAGGALAAPNLAWDVAIGQSTTATHTVVANLFYRGVVFRRAPRIGDTLRTVTEVAADGTERTDRNVRWGWRSGRGSGRAVT